MEPITEIKVENLSEPNNNPIEPQSPELKATPKPAWIRWLCYVFLVIGFGLTFFHQQLASATGIDLNIMIAVGLVTLAIGIGLFLYVRDSERIDRASAYRSLFRRDDSDTK